MLEEPSYGNSAFNEGITRRADLSTPIPKNENSSFGGGFCWLAGVSSEDLEDAVCTFMIAQYGTLFV